ncbi:MAG: ABC transporter substrate-binding protein [Robiginitomaculum sp.]|nr:ABC transporter substrate-binding protein [Robiginitomaculum sp.]MDQ7078079.1 ABC transporter substrate-binding protein [Robiginitomaculum sp.]
MRFIKILMLATFIGVFMTGAAFAAPQDEAFVQNKANEALAILRDDSLDKAAKTARFAEYVDSVTDVPRVARFVLGKYARGADPEKLATFTQVFREYASGVYESQLGNFGGETLTVLGSQDRKPGDSVVASVISGGQIEEPIKVNWRIRTRNGKQQVLDVQIFGIWLALQQRNEITSVIANHGGDIGAAIDVLREKIAKGDFGKKDAQAANN